MLWTDRLPGEWKMGWTKGLKGFRWQLVVPGIAQRLMLGMLTFNVLISYPDIGLECILRSSHHTNLGCGVTDELELGLIFRGTVTCWRSGLIGTF